MSGLNDSKRYEILSSLWSMHQKRPRDATVSYVETKQLSYVFCPAAGGSKAWMAALCVCAFAAPRAPSAGQNASAK